MAKWFLIDKNYRYVLISSFGAKYDGAVLAILHGFFPPHMIAQNLHEKYHWWKTDGSIFNFQLY